MRFFDVAGYLGLVDGGFGGAVEADDGEVAFACGGCHPVGFLSGGGFLTEVDVGAAVGVLGGFVARAEGWEGWPLARPEAFSAS